MEQLISKLKNSRLNFLKIGGLVGANRTLALAKELKFSYFHDFVIEKMMEDNKKIKEHRLGWLKLLEFPVSTSNIKNLISNYQ